MHEDSKRFLSRLRRRILSRHLIAARVVLIGIVFGFLLILFVGVKFVASKSEFVMMAGNFLFLPAGTVRQYNARTNVLLLGKAGVDPVLTDTMILASIGGEEEPGIVLISIPRDIWIAEFSDKINSAYWRGQKKDLRGGLVLAKSVVEEVLGIPVHYAIAFDFDGFAKIIDILGGVEVDVERSFTDAKYPIAGRENDECGGDRQFACRYETVSFEKGRQLMDGATALKFARSRHSEDPQEGNDLARAARQRKVLLAIKDKVTSRETLTSPAKLSQLYSTFWSTTETDLTKPQMAYLARLVFDSQERIASYALPEEFLLAPPYSPEYNNLYVFTPRAGNWQEVQSWVASIF